MLIKPDLKDEKIIAYGLTIKTVAFLPLGPDVNTAVYRVTTPTQTDYFPQLRSGEFLEASVSVPKYLADLGIKQVIPPVATSPVLVMGEGFCYGRRQRTNTHGPYCGLSSYDVLR